MKWRYYADSGPKVVRQALSRRHSQTESYLPRSLDFNRLSIEHVWLILPLFSRINGGGNQFRRPAYGFRFVHVTLFVYGYLHDNDALKMFGERFRWIDWIYPANDIPLH